MLPSPWPRSFRRARYTAASAVFAAASGRAAKFPSSTTRTTRDPYRRCVSPRRPRWGQGSSPRGRRQWFRGRRRSGDSGHLADRGAEHAAASGSEAPSQEWHLRMDEGDPNNVGGWKLGSQAGTHVDARPRVRRSGRRASNPRTSPPPAFSSPPPSASLRPRADHHAGAGRGPRQEFDREPVPTGEVKSTPVAGACRSFA